MKFNSGSRGRAPVGSGGEVPHAEAELFSFSERDCCIKTGEAVIISGIFKEVRGDKTINSNHFSQSLGLGYLDDFLNIILLKIKLHM